jgi:hypothetical protein
MMHNAGYRRGIEARQATIGGRQAADTFPKPSLG